MSDGWKKGCEAVDHLLGTCDSLHVRYEEWMNDPAFCDAVYSMIAECGTCGWWYENCELDGNGNCDDCQVEEE